MSDARKNAYAEFSRYFDALTKAIHNENEEMELLCLSELIRNLEIAKQEANENRGGMNN